MSFGEQDGSGEAFDDLDDEASELLPCPACGAMVYEEAQQCPRCGEWIMTHAAAAGQKNRLWIAAALLALVGMLFWMVR